MKMFSVGIFAFFLFVGQASSAQSALNNLTASDKPVSIVLSDKSKVWLNSKSTIGYPTLLNLKEPAIEIDGEAYVEVHSKILKEIKARDVIIKATPGTKVNIESFKNDSLVKITAVEKTITIITGDKTIPLNAGDQVLINKNFETATRWVMITDVISWIEALKKEKGR